MLIFDLNGENGDLQFLGIIIFDLL